MRCNEVAKAARMILGVATLLGFFVACGSISSDEVGARKLSVFAAVSLSEAFADISKEFERDNPGISVELQLAGSQRLRTQLEHGAQGDLFASADWKQMDLAKSAGMLNGKPVIFATNRLAVIVPNSRPAEILNTMEDLGNPGVKLAMALAEVPAGGYTRQMIAKLENAGTSRNDQLSSRIMANVVTLESSVKGVAAKVVLGEVDAGVVYFTDASAAGVGERVRTIPIPEEVNVVATFPLAPLHEAGEPDLAAEFIDLVLSPTGRRLLKSHGFGLPSSQ